MLNLTERSRYKPGSTSRKSEDAKLPLPVVFPLITPPPKYPLMLKLSCADSCFGKSINTNRTIIDLRIFIQSSFNLIG